VSLIILADTALVFSVVDKKVARIRSVACSATVHFYCPR